MGLNVFFKLGYDKKGMLNRPMACENISQKIKVMAAAEIKVKILWGGKKISWSPPRPQAKDPSPPDAW